MRLEKSEPSVRSVLATALCVSVCLLTAACARGPRPTPEASLDYARFALRDLPPEIDLDALKGRRILIDPGHGGEFSGAVGPNNLREADVNLGVGLYLWGMLKRAGADAHLTRSSDSVVFEGDDIDLKKDLQARAELAKELDADLFISLHHNADVLPGKKKNSLETYFKMSDPGSSLDVARSIHRRLALTLEQKDNVILAGNFHVLRENPVTAVLGEPSYISHRLNAFRLGLAPMQRLEAQAYFLGIAEYFSKGVPKIEEISPVGTVSDHARPLITVRVDADRGVEIDPSSITMLVDGEIVRPEFDRTTSQISYMPPRRLANGRHTVGVSLRNTSGNAAPPFDSEFEVAMPAAYLLLDSNFSNIRGAAPIRLRARVFDADLMPVADGVPVEFRVSEGLVSPNPSLTRNGEAFAYFVPETGGGPREITASASASKLTHTLKLKVSEDAPELIAVKVLDAGSRLPIENVFVSANGKPLGHSDRWGYFAAAMQDLGGAPIDFSRHGYKPLRLDKIEVGEIQTVRMKPVAGGILAGRRFVIDPRLGGENKGAMGPTGMRASDLNLDVSRRLAQLLEASGAKVTLTRDSDETVSTLSRVEVEEKFDAEWFISIGHGNAGSDPKVEMEKPEAGARAVVTHYPTSEMGERLAESIARSIRESKIAENVSVAKGTHFVLTHTGSPAVIVEGPSPAAGIEEKLRHPSAAQNEAYAIYCGILETLGLDDDSTGRISVSVSDIEGNAFPGAWLALDGVFNMAAGPGGEFIFSRLLPGDHRLAIYAGRLRLWDGVIPVGPGGETTVAVSPSGPAAVWAPATAKPRSKDE